MAAAIAATDSPRVAQVWFQGLNPQLDDRSPARLLREGDLDEAGRDVIGTARALPRRRMSCDLDWVVDDGPVYRLSGGPDPCAWPDWSRAHLDGTFRNRWDDPDGDYRVLYTSSQRVGAVVERMERFRPDLEVVAALADIAGTMPTVRSTRVPSRSSGSSTDGSGDAELTGSYAARQCAVAARHSQRARGKRAPTPPRGRGRCNPAHSTARLIYECVAADGEPFAGIRYAPRLGDEFEDWALFEPTASAPDPRRARHVEGLTGDDPDLLRAAALLGLRLEQRSGRRERPSIVT